MRKALTLFYFSLTMILCSIFCATAFAALPPEKNGVATSSLSPMLKQIMPAVVNIAAQGEIMVPNMVTHKKQDSEDSSDANSDSSNTDAQGTPVPYGTLKEFASLGSGVIVDTNKGYIMTNAHVIARAKTITVTLSDGRTVKAKPIGIDTATDIAVIQIKASKLTAMPIGNSDDLQVGDFVVAIGNPFGLNQTVTSGIVSALQRGSLGIEGPNGLENFIQTDASINPGNSGGALVNLNGQLIGINTAILSSSNEGGNIGIGFAIPINMARTIMAQLVQYGTVKRGLMGVIVQDLTPDLATAFNLSDATGAVISQVTPNSPADKGGLQPGDIVQEVNGQKMATASAVRNAIGLLRVGNTINLVLLRKGKPMNISITTADPERYLQQAEQANRFLFGLALRNFDQQMPLQGHLVGVQIMHVSKNSTAWRAGLMPGDVILSANQSPVSNIDALQKAAAQNHERLLLNVARGNAAMFVVLD